MYTHHFMSILCICRAKKPQATSALSFYSCYLFLSQEKSCDRCHGSKTSLYKYSAAQPLDRFLAFHTHSGCTKDGSIWIKTSFQYQAILFDQDLRRLHPSLVRSLVDGLKEAEPRSAPRGQCRLRGKVVETSQMEPGKRKIRRRTEGDRIGRWG